MSLPDNYKYSKDHEWVLFKDGEATVGITDFAQGELGEVVFVELPEVGKELSKGSAACVVESTKAASDVYTPIGGTVAEVNSPLVDAPAKINESPYSDGWLFKLTGVDEDEVNGLMDASAYEEFLG